MSKKRGWRETSGFVPNGKRRLGSTKGQWRACGDSLWEVIYPSGSRFVVSGRLIVTNDIHPVIGTDEKVFVLDPRCVIKNAQGKVIYEGPKDPF